MLGQIFSSSTKVKGRVCSTIKKNLAHAKKIRFDIECGAGQSNAMPSQPCMLYNKYNTKLRSEHTGLNTTHLSLHSNYMSEPCDDANGQPIQKRFRFV